jgi:hypothetical protein
MGAGRTAPPMARRKRWIAGAAVASALAVATLALAEPRARSVRAPAKSPRDDNKTTATSAASAIPSPSATLALDAGPIPAPPADESLDGGKLSPLNPAPNEFSDGGAPGPSLDYDRLLSDIASLRARVAAVSDTLFHSRIAISIETESDHGRIASLLVSLDDGVVWSSPPAFRANEEAIIYDHAAAPGHHAVTVDVERRDDRNDAFRSAQRSRFIVDVPAEERLSVELRLWDDSGMGGDFPGDKKGQYELKIRASAKAQPIAR